MELLGWLLLAALLVLSPLTWIKPSPRQQRQIQLRNKARELGIKLTLTPLQLPNGQKIYGIAYRWLRAPDATAMPGYLCLLRKDNEAATQGLGFWQADWLLMQGSRKLLQTAQAAALDAFIEQLPDNVFALEWGTATFTLWWDERGTPELVESWDAQVQKLLALPCHSPKMRVKGESHASFTD